MTPVAARETRHLWVALAFGFGGLLGAVACAEPAPAPARPKVEWIDGTKCRPCEREVAIQRECRGEVGKRETCIRKVWERFGGY